MNFEEWKSSFFSHNCSDEYMQGFEDGSELAWSASAKAHKPRWIPVSEPPKINNKVYAVLFDDLTKDVQLYEDKFEDSYDDFMMSLRIVTHWLELPELPE